MLSSLLEHLLTGESSLQTTLLTSLVVEHPLVLPQLHSFLVDSPRLVTVDGIRMHKESASLELVQTLSP